MHQHYATLGAALARPHEAPAQRAPRLTATVDIAITADCTDHVEHLERELRRLPDVPPVQLSDPLAIGHDSEPTLDEHLQRIQAIHGVDGDTALLMAWNETVTPAQGNPVAERKPAR